MKIRLGRSGTAECYVCEGICASLLPETCQRLPTAFRTKSKPLSRMTRPGRSPQAHILPLTAHTHTQIGRLGSSGRFLKAQYSLSAALVLPLFTPLLAWRMPSAHPALWQCLHLGELRPATLLGSQHLCSKRQALTHCNSFPFSCLSSPQTPCNSFYIPSL